VPKEQQNNAGLQPLWLCFQLFVILQRLEHFHSFCEADFVVSHPFHREREMDGARSFLALSLKMP
jgi:hypothetical protein